jgi:hypothetical protein
MTQTRDVSESSATNTAIGNVRPKPVLAIRKSNQNSKIVVDKQDTETPLSE